MNRRCFMFAGLLAGCAKAPKVEENDLLPDFGQLPEFSFVDQRRRAFGRGDLAGKAWILDLIFTRCTAVCPRMSAVMKELQKRLEGEGRVGLLSVSVDPEYDTPERLAAFAGKYGADPERWRFLRGPKETVREIRVKTQRHLDPEEITAHSKQFYLVDSNGYVRGVYSVSQAGAVDDMIGDLRRLLARADKPEPSST